MKIYWLFEDDLEKLQHVLCCGSWLEEEMAGPNIEGAPGSLSEDDARCLLDEIINNDQLTLEQKEYWLDQLYFKVSNCCAREMDSPVIEETMNEGTHLRYPEWRGRHGNWTSIQR